MRHLTFSATLAAALVACGGRAPTTPDGAIAAADAGAPPDAGNAACAGSAHQLLGLSPSATPDSVDVVLISEPTATTPCRQILLTAPAAQLRDGVGASWSPDGNHVEVHALFPTNTGAPLWLVDLRAATPTAVMLSKRAVVADDLGAFSPDGTWVTWMEPDSDAGGPTHLHGALVGDLLHAPQVLAELPSWASLDHLNAAWQPGTSRLLLFGDVHARLLTLGGDATQDWTFPYGYVRALWSPDGRWFTATSRNANNTAIETDLIDTQHPALAPTHLLPEQPIVANPSWAADSAHLVVGTAGYGATGAAVIFELSSGAPVATRSFTDVYPATWVSSSELVVPSTTQLAFGDLQGALQPFGDALDQWAPVPGRAAIDHRSSLPSVGRYYRPLAGPPVSIAACARTATLWSPDGSHVACPTTPQDLVVYAVDSGAMTPLALAPYGFWNTMIPPTAAWSPDGAVLALSGDDRTVMLDSARGVVHPVTPVVGLLAWRPAR